MDLGTRTAGSSGVRMGRHLRSGERVHLRAARSAQRLAIDNIREASRRRSAHIILASANTPAKIGKVERGCAVANTPDCSDSVKEIAIFTAANSLPVATQITGWRCRTCENPTLSNRHAIARGLHYRSKVSAIGAGCSVDRQGVRWGQRV